MPEEPAARLIEADVRPVVHFQRDQMVVGLRRRHRGDIVAEHADVGGVGPGGIELVVLHGVASPIVLLGPVGVGDAVGGLDVTLLNVVLDREDAELERRVVAADPVDRFRRIEHPASVEIVASGGRPWLRVGDGHQTYGTRSGKHEQALHVLTPHRGRVLGEPDTAPARDSDARPSFDVRQPLGARGAGWCQVMAMCGSFERVASGSHGCQRALNSGGIRAIRSPRTLPSQISFPTCRAEVAPKNTSLDG